MPQQLFKSGQILATHGALMLAEGGVNLPTYLHRHLTGDWGDLGSEDKEENEYSLCHNLRIFSAYNTPNGWMWIIIEADKSATTLLLPEEY